MKKLFMCFAIGAILCSCADKNSEWSTWPEWPDPQVVTVNGMELDETTYDHAMGKTFTVTKGEKINFSGIERLDLALQPDWFEKDASGDYVFAGPSGTYTFVYDSNTKMVYVDRREGGYPDAIWMCGAGWGHPGAHAVTTAGWTIDNAKDMLVCPRQEDGTYQITVYLSEESAIKFFQYHSWGFEIHAGNMEIASPLILDKNGSNDFVPGALFSAGTYRFTIDTDRGTVTADPVDVDIVIPSVSANGIPFVSNPEVPSMISAKIFLTNGQNVEFSGFPSDAERMLQFDWFENFNGDNAMFTGNNGEYYLCYDISKRVIYVHEPSSAYPSALILVGTGFGHPALDYSCSTSWDLNKPGNSYVCRRVGPNLFEACLYLGAGFDIKTFKSRDWSAGYGSDYITPVSSDILEKSFYEDANGFSHCDGDIRPGKNFVPGVYRIRFDLNRNISYLVGTIDADNIDLSRSVNGTTLTDMGGGWQSANVSLQQGQQMEFSGFVKPQYGLQPEYFSNADGVISFIAPSGNYVLAYNPVTERIYVEPTADTQYPSHLWITGWAFSHPAGTGAFSNEYAGKVNGEWGWSDPKDYIACVSKGNGIYETTMRLNAGFMFRFYKDKGSWTDVVQANSYNLDACNGIFNPADINFSTGENFTPGTYRIIVDTNLKTVSAIKISLK